MPFYPFLGEGSPTKIGYRKQKRYPYSNLSNLEDLVVGIYRPIILRFCLFAILGGKMIDPLVKDLLVEGVANFLTKGGKKTRSPGGAKTPKKPWWWWWW